MAKLLNFLRDLVEARPFEQKAFAYIPGAGGYYSKVETAGVEAQMVTTSAVSTAALAVFFRLEDPDGRFNIEMAVPFIFDVYTHALWVWASADGSVNATITDDLVNGYKTITSMIDGTLVTFTWDAQWRFYVPDSFPGEEIDRYIARMLEARSTRITKAA